MLALDQYSTGETTRHPGTWFNAGPTPAALAPHWTSAGTDILRTKWRRVKEVTARPNCVVSGLLSRRRIQSWKQMTKIPANWTQWTDPIRPDGASPCTVIQPNPTLPCWRRSQKTVTPGFASKQLLTLQSKNLDVVPMLSDAGLASQMVAYGIATSSDQNPVFSALSVPRS